MPGANTLAFCFESLYTDKLFHINFHCRTAAVGTAEGDTDTRIYLVGKYDKFRVRVVAKEVLVFFVGFHVETLDIGIALIVSIVEHCRPYFAVIKLLDAQDIVLIVVVGIDIAEVEFAVGKDDKNIVVVVEFTEEASVLLVVDAVDIRIEPYFPSAERRVSVTLQSDAVDGFLGNHIAACRTSLDENVGKIALQEDAHARIRYGDAGVECNLDDFCFAVGVSGEIHHLGTWCTLREVVLAVSRNGGYVEALDVVRPFLAVTIDNVVGGAFVVLFKDLYVQDIFADEDLLRYADNLVLAVLVEDDDVIDIGTVAYKLVLLQPCADKPFRAVDIEFLISFGNLCCHDGFKVLDFRPARMFVTIFVLDVLKPADGDLCHACQILIDIGDFSFNTGNEFFVLIFAELGNALHFDFKQAQDILLAHLTDELRIERGETLVNILAELIRGVGILKGLAFVDALFDEDAFQRGKEELFFQFVFADFQLFA